MPVSTRALPLLALAAVVLAPSVVADHVYTHQYKLVGRVMDDDGTPLSGALVRGRFVRNQEPYAQDFVTNCRGDYGFGTTREFHFHIHGLSTTAGLEVNLTDPSGPTVLEARSLAADRNLRRSHLDWTVSEDHDLTVCPGAKENASRSALVFGRLWNATRETKIESVPAWGTIPGECAADDVGAHCGEEVNVTVTPDVGAPATLRARTDNYGDYALLFEFSQSFRAARVEATWLDRTARGDLDPFFHTARVDFVQGEPHVARPPPAEVPAAGAAGAVAAAVVALVAGRRSP